MQAQTITVTPAEPYVGVGHTQQFAAAVSGLANNNVTWALTGMAPVNNPKLGTISSTGLYTAPATPPAQNPVTVQATGSDGKTIGTAYVLVEPLGPTLTSVSPSPVNVGTYKVTVSGQGFVKGAGVVGGGIALSTTFVSATQLTASGYQGSAGSVSFSVTNPGTLASNTVNVNFVTPLTVTPATANVALGASKTFSVSGGQTVTWSATAGSISSTGVFTAPATMPSSTAVTITATGSVGQTGTAKVTLTQPETPVAPPTFSPAAGTYTSAQSVSLATTTSGASIRYTVNGNVPSETAGTLYSGAFSVASTTTVKAIAFKSGMSDSAVVSAAYTINLPVVSIVVAPATASLSANQTQGLTATVTGSTNLGVTWTVTGAGTLSSTSGTSIMYTAPASIASKTTVTVTATSSADGTKSAVSTITLNPAVSIMVSPATVSLSANQSQGLTATVGGSTNLGVTWTISPATGAGTLSATSSTSGTPITYTASASITSQTSVTVTATSSADGTKSAISTITLTPAVGGPITVSPSSVSVALGGTQPFTATGQPSVTWAASAGSITTAGVFTAPTVMTATGTVTITATGTSNQVGVATVTLTGGSTSGVTAAAAKRFLQQGAFGPSPSDVTNVQNLGFQGWLNQQFAMPMVSNYQGANLAGSAQSGLAARFLANAVTNPDQLRQRVGFALSQIGVVSISTLNFNGDIIPYEELLLKDAFANYRQILGDITLSASMGTYLNMANNAVANPSTGTVANENYARELMQLFSVGTALLNQDGTRQTSGGSPVATYNQTNVTELARVLTGWTYAPLSGNPTSWGADIDGSDPTKPMVAVTAFHDFGPKTLLPDFQHGNGTSPYVASANLSPQVDLSQALDNIFYHPNVGPFVGKELIKFLVKSNPSPAYVSRVAAAFNNNGLGVRGDMQAVITAILIDPEARANDNGQNDQPTDGHLQEPVLYLAGLYRALNGTMTDQNYFSFDLGQMGQDIYNPASVFNYYSPSYTIPQTTLQGGEFQIYNTFTSLYRANTVLNAFEGTYNSAVQSYGPGSTVDFTPFVTIATHQSASAMVDAMDQALTRGVMPAAMKQIILTAVQAQSSSGPITQVETAFYLIATSDYYNVWH
jgi:uncharacterized protein (DUF1800 family)